jgi:hypothetical protein
MTNWEKHLKQIKEENKKPINRIAMLAMIKEQHKPNEMKLHCLEAAQWAILQDPNNPRYSQLDDKVETLMYYWEPRTVMMFLEREGDLIDELHSNPLLGDIATAVLEQIKNKLAKEPETFSGAKRV